MLSASPCVAHFGSRLLVPHRPRPLPTQIAGGASSSSRSSSRSGGAAAGDGHAPALNLATLDDVVRETRSVEHALGRTRLSSGGEGEEGVEGADGTATVLARSHGALLEVLQLDFPSATRGELRNALEAAGDDVDMARDLLRDSLGVPAVADAVTAAGAGAAEALLAQVERVRAMAREQGVELTEAEVEEYKAQFRARMAGVAGQDAAPAPSGATDDEHAAKVGARRKEPLRALRARRLSRFWPSGWCGVGCVDRADPLFQVADGSPGGALPHRGDRLVKDRPADVEMGRLHRPGRPAGLRLRVAQIGARHSAPAPAPARRAPRAAGPGDVRAGR